MRMVQQQLHQNFAGVTGCADNGDFFRFHFDLSFTVLKHFSKQKTLPDKPAGLGNFQCD
jgi:hypothetical protein